PGLRRLGDRGDHLVHHVVLDDNLELHLGDEVDDVGGASVHLLLAAGPTESLHLAHGHALDADGAQALLHLVELEGFDDGLDLLHGLLPNLVLAAPCFWAVSQQLKLPGVAGQASLPTAVASVSPSRTSKRASPRASCAGKAGPS